VEVEVPSDEVRLGRRPGVEVEIPFATVSAVHARVQRQGGAWVLVDEGSPNGTFLRGTRLVPGVPYPLHAGDVIRVADVPVSFEGTLVEGAALAPDGASESTATLARRLVSDFFSASRPDEVPRLQVESGPASGASLRLLVAERAYRVGRSLHCDLTLPDDDVSREHAELERRWDGVHVRDLGSKNGVSIDGQRMTGPRRLADGAVLIIGTTRLSLDDPEDRHLREARREASSLDRAGGRISVAPAPPPAALPAVSPAVLSPSAPAPAGASASAATARVPRLIVALAVTVLASIGLLAVWFALGDWA
jgi:pSer/pThr/pTyr-binding forkhead associated (FHA) protein